MFFVSTAPPHPPALPLSPQRRGHRHPAAARYRHALAWLAGQCNPLTVRTAAAPSEHSHPTPRLSAVHPCISLRPFPSSNLDLTYRFPPRPRSLSTPGPHAPQQRAGPSIDAYCASQCQREGGVPAIGHPTRSHRHCLLQDARRHPTISASGSVALHHHTTRVGTRLAPPSVSLQ